MSDWLTVVIVAAGAQLAVLPGEKVQFIIASLSTRFHPLIVVTAAATAFAGWTVLEILFGAALQNTVPGVYLDIFTAVLFVIFAIVLWQSMPDKEKAELNTDGGITDSHPDEITLFGRQMPTRFGGFLPIFLMMAAGEFGDKTQLITITLAAQFGAHPGIWVGEMLVIIPVSLVNAYVFHTFSHKFDARRAHMAGAALFVFFAADTFLAVLTGFSVWETAVGTFTDLLNSAV
jgi:putative Ca2+/H+ antiporter (TMEM165/GDT1 family)